MPYHEGHVKFSAGTIKRGKISAPIQLISTTNMLAFDAPELRSATSSSSASSMRFRDDSDMSESALSAASPITSSGSSSREGSPVDAKSMPIPLPKRSYTLADPIKPSTTRVHDHTPSIPKRALSHTKRSHQELSRQRSMKAMTPPPLNTISDSPSMRSVQGISGSEPHPFGRELEQVREIAEEFGGGHLLDEEEVIFQLKGLHRFSAQEYLAEIEDLYNSMLDDDYAGPIPVAAWV